MAEAAVAGRRLGPSRRGAGTWSTRRPHRAGRFRVCQAQAVPRWRPSRSLFDVLRLRRAGRRRHLHEADLELRGQHRGACLPRAIVREFTLAGAGLDRPGGGRWRAWSASILSAIRPWAVTVSTRAAGHRRRGSAAIRAGAARSAGRAGRSWAASIKWPPVVEDCARVAGQTASRTSNPRVPRSPGSQLVPDARRPRRQRARARGGWTPIGVARFASTT